MFTHKVTIINDQVVLGDVPIKPTIIIDKSTLETLSNAESICLSRYYAAVSTHVLLSEIGADLKKDFSKDFGGKRTPEEVVSVLADRMHGLYRFNTSWYKLLELSLLGEKIPVGHLAPVYLDAMVTYTPGTGRGIYFGEQQERKTLRAWSEGKFSDSDYEIAEQWRSEIRKIDLTSWHQDLSDQLKSFKAKSLEDIPAIVENLLDNSDYQFQFELLKLLVKLAKVSEEISTQIFNRWNQCNMLPIQDFSQYGYYCLKVYLIFGWALLSGFVGTKSTNCIDLHYLLELPFCRIFSSNDRFHKKLAPLLITDQQIFINALDLKSDLKRIEEYVDSVREEGPFRLPYPPDWDDSLTNQVWKKHATPREEFRPPTQKEKDNILKWHRRHQDHNFGE